MKTNKILLAGSTAIAFGLIAASASAQPVSFGYADGTTYAEGAFAADSTAPTITNSTPSGGIYTSTAEQTGTKTFTDNNQVLTQGGVTVDADVTGTYSSTETTVTTIDLNTNTSSTAASTYNNQLSTYSNFNVTGSNTVGTAFNSTTIATVGGSLVGNTVDLTQTVSSVDASGITFATYDGTATYHNHGGTSNHVEIAFDSTPVSGTTLNASGLTTTGDVNADNVTATGTVTAPSVVTDSVESASGSLQLGTTTGSSYVQVNEDDVVIHGGTSSTTVTVNNGGVNIANTTPGTGGTVHFTSTVGGADFTIANTGALSSANTGLNGGAVTVADDFWTDGNTRLSAATGSNTLIGQTATNATAGDVTLQAGAANKVVVNADATAANNNVTISGGSTAALATNVAVSNAGVAITSTTGGASLLIASDGSISSGNNAVAGGAVNINDGLVVGPTSGAALTGAGISTGTVRINAAGANKITGLADGSIASGSTEAITGNQLFATNSRVTTLEAGMIAVNNRVDLLSRRVDKAYQGVAMGFASNAAPLNLANGEGGISAGVGYFQGEWGGAVKAQYVTDSGVGLGLNVGFSSDAVGGGVGASIKF